MRVVWFPKDFIFLSRSLYKYHGKNYTVNKHPWRWARRIGFTHTRKGVNSLEILRLLKWTIENINTKVQKNI